MSTYKWKAPNIHPLLGAVWVHRDKVGLEWETPVVRTDIPKKLIRSSQGGQNWGSLYSEFKLPTSVGDPFYICLRKLGYRKGPSGDYE